ncbi:MAG: hypothetical protein EZS28_041543, partial [Streblomastix strix]
MPNWRGQIWNDLQRRLTVSSVVLGRAEDILIAGAVMKENQLKLQPGNLIAIKMTEVVIKAMSAETWRKGRAGVHLLKEYMDEKDLSLDDINKARPDVTMVNMLPWKNEKGGARCVADMQKIRTHVGVALGMFLNSNDVAKSSIVVAAVKELELAQRSQAKYNRTWNLDLLLTHVGKQEWEDGKQTISYSIVLLVAFIAARMIEFARITMKDVLIDDEKMMLRTRIKKDKKMREYLIGLRRQDIEYCPKALSPQGCVQVLRNVLDEIGIEKEYGGVTIRLTMMTKLRREVVTQEEVNSYTRHAPGSNVVSGGRMDRSFCLINTKMGHFMDGNCFGVAVRGRDVFKQTVLQLIGLWFRQKTRGTNVAASKAEAPFAGRGSAERMVLALSKIIHPDFQS